MFAGAVLLYLTIKKVIYRQIDESLITEKTIIEDQIRQTDTIPDFEGTFGHQIEVKLLNYHIDKVQSIKDTDIYDSKSDSFIPFRYIFSYVRVAQPITHNKRYVRIIYHMRTGIWS